MGSNASIHNLRKAPFVLLYDNGPTNITDGHEKTSLLFTNPSEILIAKTFEEVDCVLSRIDKLVAQGHHVAGYIAYEVAAAFEVKVSAAITKLPDEALIWMMVCDAPFQLSSQQVSDLIHESNTGTERHAQINMSVPSKDIESYTASIEKILSYIQAGDVYQINYTFTNEIKVTGDILALYNQLRNSQPVAYGAYINTGEYNILSFSPELFVERKEGMLTSRPMKGTIARGKTILEDQANINFLKTDPKSKAENLMIVDLIRNDMSKIAQPSSVSVDHLYAVETYRTVLQMTSTVSAKADEGLTPSKILRAMFPCGSVTGAPKIRAMEIISELETEPRGVYCGAIGHFSAGNDWAFNVPIRTMILDNSGMGRLHLGSGVVADSDPRTEYDECILKGAFIHNDAATFKLIETMLWQASSAAIPLLDLHLGRLKQSALYFQFPYNRDKISAQLSLHMDALSEKTHDQRLRLLLDNKGNVSISSIDAPSPPIETPSICFNAAATNSDDIFLFHKTTRRHLYNSVHKAATKAGYIDAIFMNEKGEVTEGAISNLVIKLDGQLITPSISCGLLNGVGRQKLCQDNDVVEMSVTKEMVLKSEAVFILNSLRGLTSVNVIDYRLKI